MRAAERFRMNRLARGWLCRRLVMNARLNGWMIGAAAAAAVVVIVLRAGPNPTNTGARVAAPLPAAVRDAPLHSTASPRRATALPPASRPDTTTAHASLAARVERLSRSGSPRDAFVAFGLLERCVRTQEFDRHLKSLPMAQGLVALRAAYGDGRRWLRDACGDLAASQLDARVALVEKAALAGVPGAASAWIEQGPFGDKTALAQRPGDPLVVAWVDQALAWVKSGATHDDVESILQLGMISLNWELSDLERVKLLVDDATQQHFDEQLQRLAWRGGSPGPAGQR
jgi:hypothetical protein